MTWYRVSLLCFIGVALAACTKVEQGVLEPSPARAALRYVNLVPDTGAVDFRIIDIIGDAPVSGAASFRTGGQPGGNATNFLPPHFPVVAGERHIRVFPNSTDPAVASIILLDTTLTFAENVYYTFYLYRGSPRMQALVTVDTLPAPAGVAFRVINLGGTAVGNADVDIVAQSATVPLAAATATFANVAPGAITAYTNLAVSTSYRGLLSAPAARSTFLASTYAPAGAVGTATVNPVAGTAVAGTAISAVIVPPSVTGTPAPQTGNPTLRTANLVTRSRDSVLVQTGFTITTKNRVQAGVFDTTYAIRAGNAGIDTIIRFRRIADVAATAVGITHGFAAGDQANVAGATQPEYNGWHSVMQLADTTTCLPPDSIRDFRRTCARLAADTLRTLRADTLFATVDTVAGVAFAGTVPVARSYTSTFRSRFRYRIGVQTPASPATGTVTYRAYTAASMPQPALSNYTIPWILYMIDRKPVLTAP
jgi:hypothetical protein